MRKLALLLLVVFLASCSSDFEEKPDNPTHESSVGNDSNLELKKKFSTALAKVLAESQDVRSLIKEEALKKIDHDYDVLYQLVKNNRLADGSTLESNLLKYIDASDLALIAEQIPTLTIFVPELPENTFSADLWDVNSEIPVVGIRTTETNDVPFIDSDGIESVIEAEYIPAFPILVVKESERITVSRSGLKSASLSEFKSANNEGAKFQFIDDIFDNTVIISEKQEDSANRTKSATDVPPAQFNRLYEGLKTYGTSSNGWQRDYIYYGLTPTNQRGHFDYKYKECIVGFELLGNPQTVLNKIADQTADPRSQIVRGSSGWTDGEFEFLVKTYVGNKSAWGTESKHMMRFAPDALFAAKYEMDPNGDAGRSRPTFKGNFTLKSNAYVNLPLFEWNLENYGSSVKISIEEVDADQTTTNTEATTTEFATNFEYNFGTGEKEKVGLKFGASTKETHTVSFVVTTTHGNDLLGDVIINFADPVILSDSYRYYYISNGSSGGRGSSGGSGTSTSTLVHVLDYNTKYYNGWYRIYIAPVKMY